MRHGLIGLCMMLGSLSPAFAQLSIHFGTPGVSIGINLPVYPQLQRVPGYPVYYAPGVNSNYFFYDGLYWVYQGDNWYASSWYNGPWGHVNPGYVPDYLLRVPVRYYRQPPAYFRGWARTSRRAGASTGAGHGNRIEADGTVGTASPPRRPHRCRPTRGNTRGTDTRRRSSRRTSRASTTATSRETPSRSSTTSSSERTITRRGAMSRTGAAGKAKATVRARDRARVRVRAGPRPRSGSGPEPEPGPRAGRRLEPESPATMHAAKKSPAMRGFSLSDHLVERTYPQAPTHPQAVQKSQPSLWMTVMFPHSPHLVPFISAGSLSRRGDSRIPISCFGYPFSSSTPSIE